MKTILISLIVLAGAGLKAQVPDFKTPNAEVSKFVRENLLYKGSEKLSTKWLTVPKLEITTDSPALKAFVEKTFAAMCQAGGLTAAGEGTFHVFLGTAQDFVKLDLVRRRRPSYHAGWWSFWTNSDKSLNETLIILRPGDDEESLKRTLFTYMLTTFGVNSDLSSRTPFGLGDEYATRLSPLDTMLIAFNYQHVPPGTAGGELPKLLRLYWNK